MEILPIITPINAPSPLSLPMLSETSRAAQQRWSRTLIAERLEVVARFTQRLSLRGVDLAVTLEGHTFASSEEVLFFEVLPLAEGCRLLGQQAETLLTTKVASNAGRPFWQLGHEIEWQFEPWGIVYVGGSDEKPLVTMMMAVFYALIAGNAVWLRPYAGSHKAALFIQQLLIDSGLDGNLLSILPEEVTSTEASTFVDKLCSMESVTRSPKTILLLGHDVDLLQVNRALHFSTTHYQGKSRAAVSVVMVPKVRHEEFCKMVADQAIDVEIVAVEDEESAINLLNRSYATCPMAIFASLPLAQSLVGRLQSPLVLVNDLIFPLQDPRFIYAAAAQTPLMRTSQPFGLLEMVRAKTVCSRIKYPQRRFARFLPIDQDIFSGYLAGRFGLKWHQRLGGYSKMTFALLLRALQRSSRLRF